MIILKWYCIILIIISMFGSFIDGIKYNDISKLFNFILIIPILIYLLIN